MELFSESEISKITNTIIILPISKNILAYLKLGSGNVYTFMFWFSEQKNTNLGQAPLVDTQQAAKK